ncbi:RNA methyltransferase [Luteithermobacter gelatinilyticus]|uniref:RNA methyltransferase n=1 Tax=Luteithermobacter gelatinilyticus TaxID=2582913 RepID=UPI001106BBE0|nr:RNA methyltransferase [Luteithermobacter gelatinilyticus]
MAGTDHTQPAILHDNGPAIILVGPQLGENIGKAVRAMYNFGLTDLRLVAPRDGWPNPAAWPAAAGADVVLDNARIYATTAEATADLHHVYATTARSRDMKKSVITPRRCADLMRRQVSQGHKVGVLFGPEKAGLKNEDVAPCAAIVSVPLNPAFASLNLAQAVVLVAYEWFQAGDETPAEYIPELDTRPATGEEMQGLFDHLESELMKSGYLRHEERRPVMIRNLRNMLSRARFTHQEVSTLRGVIRALATMGGAGWQQEKAARETDGNPEKE